MIFPYVLQGYLFVQVKYITVKYVGRKKLLHASSLGMKELESCSILQWLPIYQEKFLEVSSCEDIKMAWIFFSFPQPGFL